MVRYSACICQRCRGFESYTCAIGGGRFISIDMEGDGYKNISKIFLCGSCFHKFKKFMEENEKGEN